MLTLLRELSVRQINTALLAMDTMIKNKDAQIAALEARVAALEAAAKKNVKI